VQAETTFELTADPEGEVGSWRHVPRRAFEGDAFPRARLGDFLERSGGSALRTFAARLLPRLSRPLVDLFGGGRTPPWPFRT